MAADPAVVQVLVVEGRFTKFLSRGYLRFTLTGVLSLLQWPSSAALERSKGSAR